MTGLIEEDENIFLHVPDQLTRPDNLVKKTSDYYDALRKYYRSHSYGNYPDRREVLNITVGENNNSRALRIMDTIIKVLRNRDHEVKATFAEFGKEKVQFRIREKHMVSDKKDNIGSRILESTGELVFVIDRGSYDRKEVIDGYEKLENKISTITAMIELEGEKMIEDSIRREIQRKEYEERQRIEKEFKDRQDKELKAFKDLFLQAERLHQANIIRTYIQAVEASASSSYKSNEEFEQWKEWAMKKVSWYDPLINGPDKLLNDYHKMNLFRDLINEKTSRNNFENLTLRDWY